MVLLCLTFLICIIVGLDQVTFSLSVVIHSVTNSLEIIKAKEAESANASDEVIRGLTMVLGLSLLVEESDLKFS